MGEVVFLNGDLLPRGQALVSPFDYGFLYGYGLFETLRAYGGRFFRLQQHMARLQEGAGHIGIALPWSPAELEHALYRPLRANNLSEARVRLTVSIGEGDISPDPASCRSPTLFIAAKAFTPFPPETYRRGYRLIISSYRQNSHSPLSRLKTANYLQHLLARQEAKARGADDALLLNERGLVAEGTMSNLFLVSHGVLLTPSLESGVLNGITREAILEIAPTLGIEAEVREIRLEEVFQAQEVFLSSSLLEIMPVVAVEGKSISRSPFDELRASPDAILSLSKEPVEGRGALTPRLMAAYREMVDRETSA